MQEKERRQQQEMMDQLAHSEAMRQREEAKKLMITDNEIFLFENKTGKALKITEYQMKHGIEKSKLSTELVQECDVKIDKKM